ncbi:MAG TPA: M14 family zinc carboxypeptidase [Solirubrobacterales bacterium]|nr:M14 family zinc carboxypeptidase [Solirubrobacterales bacterium]
MGFARLTVVVLAALVLAMLGIWGPNGEVFTDPPLRGEHRTPASRADAGSSPGQDLPRAERARTGRAIVELRRVVSAGPGEVRHTEVMLGDSVLGRPIRARAFNGLGRKPLVLVVGCIHGDECAAAPVVWTIGGCPPGGDGLIVVPTLNPDGRATRDRANARGVDLNRNFASDWRPSGEAGDPEHPGPEPFSEPETLVARMLIEGLRPDLTIWFHQQADPMVRAWGPSVPAARRYARLAGMPFRRMRWLPGTAPRWQNTHHPGTSSFVVELSVEARDRDIAGHVSAIRELARSIDRGAA